MSLSPLDLLLAWGLDALIGDPRWIPWSHPVVWIGRGVSAVEKRLRRNGDSPASLVAKGAGLWLIIVLGSVAAGWVALATLELIHRNLAEALAIYISYACLATRSLHGEARAVADLVASGDLAGGRRRLAGIVGRDTGGLPAPEILRATVETVAENSSDGVVAPLFYLALGGALGIGPLLGLAYKAVNTLDSMVGYRDPRYEYFGKVAARIDDAANWLPARLTALLTAAAAHLLWRRGTQALTVSFRDGRLHKSPNSGYPEAAFAGALGVQLGGTNNYQGVPRASPRIGDPGPPLAPEHVRAALGLLWSASLGAVLLAAGVLALF